MDLLRAVIIGPAGTPYHDGLFIFDVHFPPKYPAVPPVCDCYYEFNLFTIIKTGTTNDCCVKLFLSGGSLPL